MPQDGEAGSGAALRFMPAGQESTVKALLFHMHREVDEAMRAKASAPADGAPGEGQGSLSFRGSP